MGRYDGLVTGVKAVLPGLEREVVPFPKLERAEVVVEEPRGTRMLVTVPGVPVGKPRMTRRDKWAKRPCVLRYRDWCDRVREVVGDSVPAAGQVQEVRITAYFEPPKSVDGKKLSKQGRRDMIGGLYRGRVDADNAAKAVLDTLWPANDSAIARLWVEKRCDWNARVEIEIIC